MLDQGREGRIRAMIRARKQGGQRYMTDMDMPGADNKPKAQPPKRQPQRMDAPIKEQMKKLY